jgi:hypothetical protein
MEPLKFLIAVLVLASTNVILSLAGASSRTQQVAADNSSPIGDWRGESTCVVRESACHDEDSFYHVSKLQGKPGWFAIKADRIVDGKAINMGTTNCRFENAKHFLACELPKGILRFTIEGDKMTGTMTLADGTLWRKIALKKS